MTSLKKETIPQSPYKFISNNEKTWFSFVTKKDIKYEVVFLKFPSLFHQYENICNLIYEVSIFTDFDKAPLDNIVKITVMDIIKEFFNNNKNVLLFVCDSVDDRHLKRKNKFNRWFDDSNLDSEFEKHNGINGDLGIDIHNTIIIRKDFELKQQILDAFFEINNN